MGGNPPPTDEQCLAAAAAYDAAGGNLVLAEKLSGIARNTIRNRRQEAAMRGLLGTKPVLPGFALKSTSTQFGPDGEVQREWVRQGRAPGEEFAPPEGHTVKGVSALVDQNGRTIQQWIKTREGDFDPLAIAGWLKEAFADVKPAKPIKKPSSPSEDLLTLIPCNDWHLGVFAWGKEVGENWDLKIAEKVIGDGIEDLIARSPSSGEAIVLGGGDLTHADNKTNQTAHSGAILDVDGRYPKIVMAAGRVKVRAIDAALRRHAHVTVRILPGNHDEHTAVAIAYFLLAWYRNEPRVTVDVDPSLFFYFRFGKVLIGATHGHTVKLARMPSIMAHRRAEDWGSTRFRYVHGFHLHHSAKIATEGEGVISEIHQAPIPQDSWHFGSGFLSGRSLQAVTYHAQYGEVSRVRVAILDGAQEAA